MFYEGAGGDRLHCLNAHYKSLVYSEKKKRRGVHSYNRKTCRPVHKFYYLQNGSRVLPMEAKLRGVSEEVEIFSLALTTVFAS